MPFTPAHPAIVLPLLKIDKRYVSATGLVVGSVVPDFEYFFKMHVSGEHGHTLAGIFYFDLPVAILLSLVYHEVMKRNFISNLPGFLQRRFIRFRSFEFLPYLKKYPLVILASMLVGIASHLFWDSFTHNGGYFTKVLPIYRYAVPFQGAKYPMFYALQHFSTLFGLGVVLVTVAMMKPDDTIPVRKPTFNYWFAAIGISGTILALRFLIDNSSMNLGNFVVSTIMASCTALVLIGFIHFKAADD